MMSLGLSLSVAFCIKPAQAETDEELNNPHSPLDRGDEVGDHYPYLTAHSHWSVGFRVAASGFPTQSALGFVYQFTGEWILPFQKWGLFSVGGNFGSFPLNAANTELPYPMFRNVIGGLQFRYQLKYTDYQLVVPTAYVGMNYYRILRNSRAESEYVMAYGPGLGIGLMLNLGMLDSATARESYQSIGLSRAYLTAELQTISVAADVLTIDGTLYLLGIRLEFE